MTRVIADAKLLLDQIRDTLLKDELHSNAACEAGIEEVAHAVTGIVNAGPRSAGDVCQHGFVVVPIEEVGLTQVDPCLRPAG